MKLIENYNEILKRSTRPVDLTEIPGMQDIVQDMHATMLEHRGLGLAAPQVGLDISLFVMNCSGNKRTCFNPQIISTDDNMNTEKEGCLSFPFLHLSVTRPFSIVASWVDENGYEYTETLMGLEARCFLHEWDHCQGIVFTDRVGKTTLHLAKKAAVKRARRSK